MLALCLLVYIYIHTEEQKHAQIITAINNNMLWCVLIVHNIKTQWIVLCKRRQYSNNVHHAPDLNWTINMVSRDSNFLHKLLVVVFNDFIKCYHFPAKISTYAVIMSDQLFPILEQKSTSARSAITALIHMIKVTV